MADGSLIAEFWNENRGRTEVYDFSDLGLRDESAEILRLSFKISTGGLRASSRRAHWSQVHHFARFLKQFHSPIKVMRDLALLSKYREYLLTRGPPLTNAKANFNFIRRLMRNAGDFRDDLSFTAFAHGTALFPSTVQKSKRHTNLSPQELRTIIGHCRVEVNTAIAAFSIRERIEAGVDIPESELGKPYVDALRTVIDAEARGIYTQVQLKRGSIELRRATRLMDNLQGHRWLTTDSALPYYLLLLTQTAGNPDSLREIPVDCLEPHPSDPARSRLYWDKPRAQREQSYDVMNDGTYSVPRCVSDLRRLTTPLRRIANENDKNRLFICRWGGSANYICRQGMHDALARFRKRNALKHFTFSDIRRVAAELVDSRTQSTSLVRKTLQHKDWRTSLRYLESPAPIDRRYELVAKFQGKMLDLAAGKVAALPSSPLSDTNTGIQCTNNMTGFAEGSTPGRPCLQWLKCAQCPNAVVIRDDPHLIARIIKAAESLREHSALAARKAEATQHFEATYRSTLEIIEKHLLPKIPKPIRDEAETIAVGLPPIPLME